MCVVFRKCTGNSKNWNLAKLCPVRGEEAIGRAFFCTQVGRRIVILHSFIKKTQQTPANELKIARKRLKEVQREQNQDQR